MALRNFVNIITDKYNPEKIDDLFEQYGAKKEGFSGSDGSLGSMTALGWLTVIAIMSIKNGDYSKDKIISSIKKIAFSKNEEGTLLMEERSSEGYNLLMQIFLYFNTYTSYSYKDIQAIVNAIYSKETLKKHLKQQINEGSLSYYIVSQKRWLKDEKVQEMIIDNIDCFVSYKINNIQIDVATTLLHTLVVSDNEELKNFFKEKWLTKAIEKAKENTAIESGYSIYEAIFGNMSSSVSNELQDAISIMLSILNKEELDEFLKEDGIVDTILLKAVSPYVENKNLTPDLILKSIDLSSTNGIMPENIKFDLSGFISNIEKKDIEKFGFLNIYINSLRKDINVDIVRHYIGKYINPFIFPFVLETGTTEGITLLSDLCYYYNIENPIDSYKDLLNDLFENIKVITENLGDNQISKFIIFNAVCGSSQEFSGGKILNLYGPLYIIFDKVNKIHFSYCKENNVSFDSDEARTKVLTLLYNVFDKNIFDNIINFSSYSYWCEQADKVFSISVEEPSD